MNRTLRAVASAVLLLLFCLSGCRSLDKIVETATDYEEGLFSQNDSSESVAAASSDLPGDSAVKVGGDPAKASPSSDQATMVDSLAGGDGQSGSGTPDAGLTFDGANYCYRYLSRRQKDIYALLYRATVNMQSGWIDLGKAPTTRTDLAMAVYALETDYPDLFWIPYSYYSEIRYDSPANPRAYIAFAQEGEAAYLVSRQDKERMVRELNDAVGKIKSQITATDPYEIELQLHDLLCRGITYSRNTDDPLIYTAYSALVKGEAVCEGYARAMQLLLREFGIRSTLAIGTADGVGHMWNVVELGGSWYHVDLTWDDAQTDYISHAYFNLTDSQILQDRTLNEDATLIPENLLADGVSFNYHLPVCDHTDQNYFVRTGYIYRESDDPAALADYIAAGDSGVTEVWFGSTALREKTRLHYQDFINELNADLAGRHLAVVGIAIPNIYTMAIYTTGR